MSLEQTGSLGGQGARGPLEMRVSPESPVPQERREKPAMREMQDQTEPPEKGAVLGKEDLEGPQVRGAQEETRVKLDPKVTKDEKAPSVSPVTRARLAPSGQKDTEVMRDPQGPRVPEELQGLQAPPETPG